MFKREDSAAGVEGQRRRLSLRRRRSADDAPRLVLRFALQAALVLAVGGGVILFFVRGHASSQAEDNVRFHTRFVADTILRDRLRPSDFQRPVTGTRRVALDDLFRSEVLASGALRVNLYGPTGELTYSSDRSFEEEGENEEKEEKLKG